MAATTFRKRCAPLDDIASFGSSEVPDFKRRRVSLSKIATPDDDGQDYCRDQDPRFMNRVAHMSVIWQNFAAAISTQQKLRKERDALSLKVIVLGDDKRSLTQQVQERDRDLKDAAKRSSEERKRLEQLHQHAEKLHNDLAEEVFTYKEAAAVSIRDHDQTIADAENTISALNAKVIHHEITAAADAEEHQRLLQEYNKQTVELQRKDELLQQYEHAAQTFESQKPATQYLSHLFEQNDAVDAAREEGRQEIRQALEEEFRQKLAGEKVKIRQEFEQHFDLQYEQELNVAQQQSGQKESNQEPIPDGAQEHSGSGVAASYQQPQHEADDSNTSTPPTRVALAPKSSNTKLPVSGKLDTKTRTSGIKKPGAQKGNKSSTFSSLTGSIAKFSDKRQMMEERRQRAQEKLSKDLPSSAESQQYRASQNKKAAEYMSQDLDREIDLAERHYLAEQWDKLPYKEVLHSQDATRWLLFINRRGQKPMRCAIEPCQLEIDNKHVQILPYPKSQKMSPLQQVGYAKLCMLAQIPECQAEAAETFMAQDLFQTWLRPTFGSVADISEAPGRVEWPALWGQAVKMLKNDTRFQKACSMWSNGAAAKDQKRCWPPTFETSGSEDAISSLVAAANKSLNLTGSGWNMDDMLASMISMDLKKVSSAQNQPL